MIVATVVGVVLVVAILFVVLNLGSVGAAPRGKSGRRHGGTTRKPPSTRAEPKRRRRSDPAGLPGRRKRRADLKEVMPLPNDRFRPM
jgi:hypothetical protein